MKFRDRTRDRLSNETAETQRLRVQTERYGDLPRQILELTNLGDSRTDLIKEIVSLVKAATGCEAVGIRLREGEDFPYYEAIGFPEAFLQAERYLCARGPTGEAVRDPEGNPYLECMCGNVLCGRTDPSLPFFTEGGSFWTNSTTALLATTTEKDRQGRTRNRCNSEGYESVALIPLRRDNRISGLLQLNDSQGNLFTPGLVTFFEGVASSIEAALRSGQRGDAAPHEEQKPHVPEDTAVTAHEGLSRYEGLFQYAPVSIWEEDFSEVKRFFDALRRRGVRDIRGYFAAHPEEVLSLARRVRILRVNETTLRMFKAGDEAELCRGLNMVFSKESYDAFREELIALAEGKTEFQCEAVGLTLRGEQMRMLVRLVVPPGYESTLSRVYVCIVDITGLKRVEGHREESEEKYRRIVQESPDAVMVIDAETGIIVEASRKAEELLGYAAPEIVGMRFTELCPGEEPDSCRGLFEEHRRQGRSYSENLVVSRKNGGKVSVSVNSGILEIRGRRYISAIMRRKAGRRADPGRKRADDDCAGLLTARETEVLRMIASGMNAKQISEGLYLSERTVRKHRDNIMRKLDVHKSVELLKYAQRCGLVDEGPAAPSEEPRGI